MENNILIDFKGVVRYDTIGELIHAFKCRVHTTVLPFGIYKKLLLIMIESLENIMKYSEYPQTSVLPGSKFEHIFRMYKQGNQYVIEGRNSLASAKAEFLQQRLNHLNGLDAQGLKDFYKATITNGEFTPNGGAGLGLIEIRKTSGNHIDYQFDRIDDNYCLYTMLVYIN